MGLNPLRDHVAKSTARPEVSLIALVCAGYEKTIAKDSWRSPSIGHIDYLNRLDWLGVHGKPGRADHPRQCRTRAGKRNRLRAALPGGSPPPGKGLGHCRADGRNLPKVGGPPQGANHRRPLTGGGPPLYATSRKRPGAAAPVIR